MEGSACTLAQALTRRETPAAMTFVAEGGRRRYSHHELGFRARRMGRALQECGIKAGSTYGIVVPDLESFVSIFLGGVLLGAIPVPIYPPLTLESPMAYRSTVKKILSASRARILIVGAGLKAFMQAQDWLGNGCSVIVADELPVSDGECEVVFPQDSAPVLLQFTSGSSGTPKGVVVTHASLKANASACVQSLKIDPERDRAASWLPLHHDMGLIGFVLGPLLEGFSSWLMPTFDFLRRPLSWIDLLDEIAATITMAPNFGYGLVVKSLQRSEGSWDLSALRVVGCGGEPIQSETLRRFQQVFSCYGLRRDALLSVYGLAEATLVISFSECGRSFRTLRLDLDQLTRGRVVPASGGVEVEIASCGTPVPGHSVEVVDREGRPLPEDVQGEIVFQGKSVGPGYFGAPAFQREVFREGRLFTGDLGFLHDGEIYVTGRAKHVIIIRGRNYHPQEFEEAAAQVPGVRRDCVVAFSRPGRDSEEVVLAIEGCGEDFEHSAVVSAVRERIGVLVADVVTVPEGTLPKTASGKLQRPEARARYLRRELGQSARATPLHDGWQAGEGTPDRLGKAR